MSNDFLVQKKPEKNENDFEKTMWLISKGVDNSSNNFVLII